MGLIRELGRGMLDLLCPPRCLACGVSLAVHRLPLLCPDCRQRTGVIGPPLCRCCGAPLAAGRDHLCGDCLAQPPPFTLARSALLYQEPVSSLIRAWKFNGQTHGLPTLLALAIPVIEAGDLSLRPDLILPVPLHRRRLRQRGFNQALQLARGCFPDHGHCLAATLLVRRRETKPQAGLSGRRRRGNLAGAFALTDPARIRGAGILLVDDVWTTGTTVRECCRVLNRAGAGRVEVFTLARSVRER